MQSEVWNPKPVAHFQNIKIQLDSEVLAIEDTNKRTELNNRGHSFLLFVSSKPHFQAEL